MSSTVLGSGRSPENNANTRVLFTWGQAHLLQWSVESGFLIL